MIDKFITLLVIVCSIGSGILLRLVIYPYTTQKAAMILKYIGYLFLGIIVLILFNTKDFIKQLIYIGIGGTVSAGLMASRIKDDK